MTMNKRKGIDFFKSQGFLQGLRGMVESLPSEEAKQEIILNLNTLIKFLNEVRERLNALPTQQSSELLSTIERLQVLFADAKNNPVLAAALGINSSARRQKSQPLKEEDIERAKLALSRLEDLSIDEIQTALNEMALHELQSIASIMGLRTTQKTARATLAQHIAMKITNVRGYRSLREGSDQLSSDDPSLSSK